ncbi:helix-turn-helix domain-containing protein [Actinoalloteichus sp. GBA129-24]|uniref:helix-turn-helix domain-containing protein n=1 Tax=Actinoalloteichus sp. GBA129-24 TaxID=1612551 RepID=UPI0009508672|nr:helix-turn-helix transcriptional regulator [Actinoalloteichus sp. GBA129-24]APU19281.1 DNA binding protein with helix-turn-helix domain [Actinoalloteichus sp. GBA129-24]
MERFGDVLARLRRQAGLTQAELADAAHWSQSQISRAESHKCTPDAPTVQRLDEILAGNGALTAFFVATETKKGQMPMSIKPWGITDIVRRLHRSDVGVHTLDQLALATEQMCCDYAWRDARELHGEAMGWLSYASSLLDGPTSLREHREVLLVSGWLMLLLGCLEYDLGLARQADLTRAAALEIGREIGHGEIIAWSFELSAWFALTQGRLRAVSDYAAAGTCAAPNSSVAVQLAAQSAKAQARMGDIQAVHRELDDGFRLLGRHDHPTRPENHFVIDPTKWDFYAMDCYRLVGDDTRAADHAHEVLRLSRLPHGAERSPMRATEARFTLGIGSLRNGDLDGAHAWTRAAVEVDRRSLLPFTMLAQEVHAETRRLYPRDPAAAELRDYLTDTRAALPS